jgi:hypothetical protein
MIAAIFSGNITTSTSGTFSANFARDIITKLVFTAQLLRSEFVAINLLFCREFTAE